MKFIRRVLPPLLLCCLAVCAHLYLPLSPADTLQPAEDILPAYSGSSLVEDWYWEHHT